MLNSFTAPPRKAASTSPPSTESVSLKATVLRQTGKTDISWASICCVKQAGGGLTGNACRA